MQTLWTRIVRTQIARSQCSHKHSARSSSTALVTRRSATPVQRRLGLNDVCTALFSTIIFASAVADGNRKSTRLEEWVRVIKDAENDLRALKVDQERRISSLARPVQSCLTSHVVDNNVSEPQTWQEVFTWAEGEIRERRALGYEDWQGVPLNVLREASASQIQHFQDRYRHCFPRFKSPSGPEVWNTVTWPLYPKKMRVLEWAVAYMTLQMMFHAPGPQESSPYDRPERMDEVLSQVFPSDWMERKRRLKRIFARLSRLGQNKESHGYYLEFESPEYPRYSVDQVLDTNGADQLNANLHALFETKPSNDVEITKSLPKICYYLLTSNAPPDVHTYNLLLSQFAGHNQNDLVELVLQSIKITHMRPNEVTLAETLRYYVRTAQSTCFDRYVDKMDAYGGDQVPPYLDIPDLLKFNYRVRVRVLQNGIGGKQDEYFDYGQLREAEHLAMKRKASVSIYQKPRRNLAVYQALIEGALAFHGMSEAMNHYRTMTNEGWEPDKEILLSILRRCLVDGDWNAGIATWTQLHRCHASDDERAYTVMVQLCQKMNRYDLTQELLQNGVARSILPPTVVEMGWHVPSQHEVTQDPDKALSEAKKIWTLEQGLEDLVREQRAAGEDLVIDLERVNLLTSAIEASLRFPSLDTIALLHEARILSSDDHELSRLDISLRGSGVRILGMVNELKDIQLSTRVLELETQLQNASFAMVQYMEAVRSLLFSTCSQSLEGCLDSVSTSIMQLHDDFQFQKFCIDVNRLSARYNAIKERMYLIRKEKAALVDGILPQKRMIHRMMATAAEAKESLPDVHRNNRRTSGSGVGEIRRIFAQPPCYFSVDLGGSNGHLTRQLQPTLAERLPMNTTPGMRRP